MIGAISEFDSAVRANYTFVLDLVKPANNAPYFVLPNDIGSRVLIETYNTASNITYALPIIDDFQNDNVTIHVDLAEIEADYFLYDAERKEVR